MQEPSHEIGELRSVSAKGSCTAKERISSNTVSGTLTFPAFSDHLIMWKTSCRIASRGRRKVAAQAALPAQCWIEWDVTSPEKARAREISKRSADFS